MMRLFFLLCILIAPYQALAQETGKVFNAETSTLDNGLQVVVIPNHRAPVITHMLWYKVGAADEPYGTSGIAHFLEHLMFKGSDGLKPGEFSETVRALGGNDNAFTGQDYTAYFQSIASEHLETVMKMEAGRMRGLNPPPEEVESERKVILEERRQRTDNDPRGRFGEKLTSALFVNHPYGTPIIGWYNEMESLTWKDAKSFYDTWYAPNNAVLIVAGDVTPQQVFDLAQKIYGPIEKRNVPERVRPQSPPLNGKTLISFEHPAIRQPVIQKGYRVPCERQNMEEALALQVLHEIVGAGATSRLYKSLVINQKIASGAGLSYRAASWDDATMTIYATPLPGVKPEDAEKALEEELRLLIAEGVTDAELEDAKSRLQAEAIYARDSLSGPAMVFGYSLATGTTIDDVEYWPANIAKVTAADIQKVAAKYLNPDEPSAFEPVTGYLLPASIPQIEQQPAAGDEE